MVKIGFVSSVPSYMGSIQNNRNYAARQPISNKRKSVAGALLLGITAFYFRKPLKNYWNKAANSMDMFIKS